MRSQVTRLLAQAKRYPWLIVFISTAAGSLWQWSTSIDLERKKHEADLIQKAIEPVDKRIAAENLRFLIELDLVSPANYPRLREYAEHPDRIPGFAGAAIRDHIVTIKQVKSALQKAGTYKGKIDGDDTPEYRHALALYQVDTEGITDADGLLGGKTLKFLWKQYPEIFVEK